MKNKKILIIINIIIFILMNNRIISNNTNDTLNKCTKYRLPDIINSYQPILVPVCDIDEKVFYFDRKWHPENTNGTKDPDDIWTSKKNLNGYFTEIKNLNGFINTNNSDVLFTLTPDSRKALVYGKYSDNKTDKLPGFSIINKFGNHWSFPKELKIKNYYNNSNHYFGFLSSDTNVLILSIQRDDTHGDLDLYISFFNDSIKEWSEPKNLGNIINTKNTETSPFLAYDNKTLYFATNRGNDSNNKDIYMTKRLDNTWFNWTEPLKLDNCINSQFDESGIWLTATADSCYIVSSDTCSMRSGIYKSYLNKKYRPEPYLIIRGKLILGDEIDKDYKCKGIYIKYLKNNILINRYIECCENQYLFIIEPTNEIEYIINDNNNGIELLDTYKINLLDKTNSYILNYDVNLYSNRVIKNDTLVIFYEFNTTAIDKNNLDKINNFLYDYMENNYNLEIRGFADSVGTDKYNLQLSFKRANEVNKYIINTYNNIHTDIKYFGEKYSLISENKLNRKVVIIKKRNTHTNTNN